MVPALIFGLALLFGLLLLGRWFVQAEPKTLVKFIRGFAIVMGVLFVIFIAVSGRWAWLPGLAFAALPWLHRFRTVRTFAKNARGPSAGQSSEVNTGFLRMMLDHDTGEMDGEVLAGRFAGNLLSDLSLGELLALAQECAADAQSLAVLETYLDRTQPDWRDAAGAGPGNGAGARATGDMTSEEAYEILGVEPGASDEEIEGAYRRLMQKMHPDHGGSDYLAAKINQAKDFLLRRH